MQRGIAGIAAFLLSTGSVLAQVPEGFAPPRADTVVPGPAAAAPEAPTPPAALPAPPARRVPARLTALPKPAAAPAGGAAPAGEAIAPPTDPSPLAVADPPAPSGAGQRFWADAGYLRWWTRGTTTAFPLAATGSLADPRAGVLGQPNTSVVMDPNINYPGQNGYFLGAGYWFDQEQTFGVAGNFFMLSSARFNRSIGSDATGAPLLTRPFVDPIGFIPGATPGFGTFDISFPGQLSGNFAESSTTHLLGTDLHLVASLYRTERFALKVLGGFRYLNLDEDLVLAQQSTVLVPGIYTFNGPANFLPVGSRYNIVDGFQTRNQFYGGQVGARAEGRFGRVLLGLEAKLAAGETSQAVNTSGTTTVVVPGGFQSTVPGGLLVQNSNSGHATGTMFSLVPEFGCDVGVQVTQHLQVRLGYTFLYWTQVLRPGAQIDPYVNTNQVPASQFFGTAPGSAGRPTQVFNRENFWAQGLSLGLRFSY